MPQKVLVLFDMPEAPPRQQSHYKKFLKLQDWEDERDIYNALNGLKKYDVELHGIYDSVKPLIQKIEKYKPDVVFSVAESFSNVRHHAPNIVGLLELLGVPYTGATPESMTLCRDKGLSKKILEYHQISVPKFQVIPVNQATIDLTEFPFPAIVKPLNLEASEGITQNSLVHSAKSGKQAIQQLMEQLNTDIIIEEFIPGKDIYVGVLGNQRPTTLPPRELIFAEAKNPSMRFATYKAKWDKHYRKKWGIRSVKAKNLEPTLQTKLDSVCKKIYELFCLKGYARIDLRVHDSGQIYFLEANPNPAINQKDEFALSASAAGIKYPQLIDRIVQLGVSS